MLITTTFIKRTDCEVEENMRPIKSEWKTSEENEMTSIAVPTAKHVATNLKEGRFFMER